MLAEAVAGVGRGLGKAAEFELEVTPTPDPAWTAVRRVMVGAASRQSGLPDSCVLVRAVGRAMLRIDVYYPVDEYHLRAEAESWGGWIIVGFGARAALLSQDLVFEDGGAVREIALSDPMAPDSFDYFCSLHSEADTFFITSGQRVFRIGADGALLWKSPIVGLDGVLVSSVAAGVVEGRGEWDPPGGWSPFTLALESGALISGGA